MRCRNAVLWSLALALIATIVFPPAPSAAQVQGNSFTSERNGFSLSWDDSWRVLGQTTIDGGDGIVLTNGISVVAIVATVGGDPRTAVATWEDILELDPNYRDVTLVEADHDATSASATFALSPADPDTGQDDLYTVESRTIRPDGTILTIASTFPAAAAAFQAPLVRALTARLVAPSLGEPGPVFLTAPWRVSIVAAQRRAGFPDLGLDPAPGEAWLIVVADATNLNQEPVPFHPEEFGVRGDAAGEPGWFDAATTAAVAAELGAEPEAAAGTLVEPGLTSRVVLVFRTPADLPEPALERQRVALPLATPLAATTDLRDLDPVVAPPPLEEVEVAKVVDGQTLDVVVADGSTQSVRLIGVDAPVGADCFAQEAVERLARLAGTRVWLEADPGTEDGDGELVRYVHAEKRDGGRVLLNRQLVAGGFAAHRTSAPDARFDAWLAEAERGARAKPAGIWNECPDPQGAPRDDPPADAVAAPSATSATESREETDATDPAAAPTADERAYLQSLDDQQNLLDLSLARYEELMTDPRPDDPDWLNRLVLVFVSWVLVDTDAHRLEPPPRYADLHAAYLDATGLLTGTARGVAPGIDAWLAGEADRVDLIGFDLATVQAQAGQALQALDAFRAFLADAQTAANA